MTDFVTRDRGHQTPRPERRAMLVGDYGQPFARLEYHGNRWWLTIVNEKGEGGGIRITAAQAHHLLDVLGKKAEAYGSRA